MAFLGRINSYRMRAMKCFIGLTIFLVCASMAVAQQSTGTILGTVKDASGAAVAGATITANSVDTGTTRTVTTGDDGSYRISGFPIGRYTVQAQHEGFSVESHSGLTLTVAQEAVVNFTLQVGAVSQTVSVTGEAPLINTTSGALASLVDEQKIADLPLNGRNYVDLMMLQPGISQQVNKGAGGGQIGTWFSNNGAPVRSNNMMLDGAILNNIMGAGSSAATGSTLGIDGIQEWRVITNSFSAEYGMTMGSEMIIASKGGTNTFHGDAFEYLRNNVLDATNFFYVPTAANGFARIPPYKRNQFGGSFGGPIKKDKTFFYAVYEGLRERLGVTNILKTIPAADHVTTNNPGCGGCNVPAVIQPILAAIPSPNISGTNNFTNPYSQPTTEDYGQMRVDQNIGNSDSFFARYTIDQATQIQSPGFPQFTLVYTSRNQYLTLSENHIFSPTLLNTARFSFSRTPIIEYDPVSALNGPPTTMIQGRDFGVLNITGVSQFGNVAAPPASLIQNIFAWSDDVVKTMGGTP